MLYPLNGQPFSRETFQSPPVEYRDVPFWAWNTAMTQEDVDFCLGIFKEMGMGGGFLHSRTGMDLPYLGREFMELVAYAQKKAKETGLRAWLYDEDRWPSGFAGGLVTAREEYRSKYLVWTTKLYREGEAEETSGANSTSAPVRSKNRRLLGTYRVESSHGYMSGYERLCEEKDEEQGKAQENEQVHEQKAEWPGRQQENGQKAGWPGRQRENGQNAEWPDRQQESESLAEQSGGQVWRAYVEVCGDNPWFNNQAYVDTLNPKAIKAFLDSTYEPYKDLLGSEFGAEIPAIFTDEPQFTPKGRAGSIDSLQEVIMPFTDELPRIFEESYGFDLLDYLPELFYEKEGEYSRARYCYHELVSRLFAESYCRQIGKWCEENHIALTGHLMKEPLLSSQTAFVGEAMRAYSGFQIPGMDLLCDRREMTTAKQVQSAVHQYDREGMISELYGVTNWSFDFRRHKLQGDWQAALGVTVRAPHLAWTSMEGEAKRDYPASIFYQSPWYREYRLIEDYFARIAVVMSRGRAVTDIGVIHPVESCWLMWGTQEKTGEAVRELDQRFVALTDWLLGKCLDFDFISEGLIPELYGGIQESGCRVGAMNYRVILVPWMETIKGTTLDMLEEWQEAGGEIIFLGKVPSCVDGVKSERPLRLSRACKVIRDADDSLWGEMKEYAQVQLFYGDYERAGDLLCQMRREGEERYLFIAHRDNPGNQDLVTAKRLTVRMKGMWDITVLNPLDGTERALPADQYTEDETEISLDWYDHDSLLLSMVPAAENVRSADIVRNNETVVNVETAGNHENVRNADVVGNHEIVRNADVIGNHETVGNADIARNHEMVVSAETAGNYEILRNTETGGNHEAVRNPEIAENPETGEAEMPGNAEGVAETEVSENKVPQGSHFGGEELPVKSRCPVTLSEPNVLVLDMPEYSFGGESWQGQEEILRIDNILRQSLGYPLRTEAWPQPWTRKKGKKEDVGQEICPGKKAGDTVCQIRLRYVIDSQVEIPSVKLGLEQPEETVLFWNGVRTDMKDDGWYVDRRIRTVVLGTLKKGKNELLLMRDFHERANLEAIYLLGDFGVKVSGRRAVVTEPVRKLDFGDWTVQGLPFYGGNVIYHMETQGRGTPAQIEVSRFTTPLVSVDIEGRRQGVIAFSPYKLALEPLREGDNVIDLTAFGNRVNTFGALHNSDLGDNRSAPDYWRTKGCGWSYEYCIRPMGILKTPLVTV